VEQGQGAVPGRPTVGGQGEQHLLDAAAVRIVQLAEAGGGGAVGELAVRPQAELAGADGAGEVRLEAGPGVVPDAGHEAAVGGGDALVAEADAALVVGEAAQVPRRRDAHGAQTEVEGERHLQEGVVQLYRPVDGLAVVADFGGGAGAEKLQLAPLGAEFPLIAGQPDAVAAQMPPAGVEAHHAVGQREALARRGHLHRGEQVEERQHRDTMAFFEAGQRRLHQVRRRVAPEQQQLQDLPLAVVEGVAILRQLQVAAGARDGDGPRPVRQGVPHELHQVMHLVEVLLPRDLADLGLQIDGQMQVVSVHRPHLSGGPATASGAASPR